MTANKSYSISTNKIVGALFNENKTYLVILGGVEISAMLRGLSDGFTGDGGGVWFVTSVAFCFEGWDFSWTVLGLD